MMQQRPVRCRSSSEGSQPEVSPIAPTLTGGDKSGARDENRSDGDNTSSQNSTVMRMFFISSYVQKESL